MKLEDALKTVFNSKKWHEGFYSRQYAWNMKDRFKQGKLPIEKQREILLNLGWSFKEEWQPPKKQKL